MCLLVYFSPIFKGSAANLFKKPPQGCNMTIKKVVVPAFYLPAQFIKESVTYNVTFSVQGGKPCEVAFETEAEASFYAVAARSGAMQVIHSEYRPCDEDGDDCSVAVLAPGSSRFTTAGMDVRSDPDCFAHSWDRWADWKAFMPFFPAGTMVASVGKRKPLCFWQEWDGTGWVDCAPPFQTGRILG